MPMARTHQTFVKDLNYNKNYLYSGAIFPDYFSFTRIHLGRHHQFFELIRNKKAIDFAKEMLCLSKTKEEKAFSVGFLSHIILDRYFHDYLKKNKITSIEDHLSTEFFYDTKFKRKMDIPFIVLPKGLLERTILKHYKKKIKLKVYFYELMLFSLYLKTIQREIIDNKHINPKPSYVDILALFFYKKPVNLNKIIMPDKKLKRHIKNLELEFKKAKKEMLKIISH